MAMRRGSIARTDFKHNFLKEIIMRLDFQGVFQAEMEKVLVAVKPYLKEKAFTRYEQKITNQIINDGNVTDVKSQVSHVFTAEASGFVIELSTSSIILTVHTQTYSAFEEYAQIFSHIADVYRSTIDFFTVQRFGLRKINICFIKNKELIKKYFSDVYYNCEEPVSGFRTRAANRRDTLSNGKHNINMHYAVEEGKLGEELGYKITLDSDIYITAHDEIEQTVFNDDALKAINEILFEIFIKVITDDLIAILARDESPSPDEIMGVDDNA